MHPGIAYGIWYRVDGSRSKHPSYFSRTTDWGRSWSRPRPITDTSNGVGSIGEVIVVDPRTDTLYDVYDALTQSGAIESVKWSKDQGTTWSAPVKIAVDQDVRAVDPVTGAVLRTGSGLPDVAIDRTTGELYVVWEDSASATGSTTRLRSRPRATGATRGAPRSEVNKPTGLPACADRFGSERRTA